MGGPQPSLLEDLGPVDKCDGMGVDLHNRVVPPEGRRVVPHLIEVIDIFGKGRSRDRYVLDLVKGDLYDDTVTQFKRADGTGGCVSRTGNA